MKNPLFNINEISLGHSHISSCPQRRIQLWISVRRQTAEATSPSFKP